MISPSELICILARLSYWYGPMVQVDHIDDAGQVFLKRPNGEVYQALDRPLPRYEAFKEAK